MKKLLTLVTLLLALPNLNAANNMSLAMPDFTMGDAIPVKAKHDWNLGATRARGWMICDQMVTSDARQVAITKVEKGSPAEADAHEGQVRPRNHRCHRSRDGHSGTHPDQTGLASACAEHSTWPGADGMAVP